MRSIVGRFLEHSRIFYFENACQPEVFVGSADWMPRNFFRRIETMFPVEDPALQRRISEQILGVYLSDNTKASVLGADGVYSRVPRAKGSSPRDAQDEFMSLALGEARLRRKQRSPRVEHPVRFEVVKAPAA